MGAAKHETCSSCSAAVAGGARFCGKCGAAMVETAPTHGDGAPGPKEDFVGREIAGRYRILGKLGEGGMGAVYRAEQISLKRKVALKLLKPELSGTKGLVKRFKAEAELAAKLKHPNTVTLYDFGQDDDGALFIAMEFVEGTSLRHEMHHHGPLPLSRILHIAEQVCASLSDAHDSGIVHRDLKPDNVMLTTRGRREDEVLVLDFGIAKLRDDQGDVTQALTQAGDMLGTPQYMAPEQIRGEPVDGRTDVYAMGVMLYEMVTGRLPFEGPTLMAVISKHITDMPALPSERRPDLAIPSSIDRLIMECLQKQRVARPRSMDALRDKIIEAATSAETAAMGVAKTLVPEQPTDPIAVTSPGAAPTGPVPSPAPGFTAGSPQWAMSPIPGTLPPTGPQLGPAGAFTAGTPNPATAKLPFPEAGLPRSRAKLYLGVAAVVAVALIGMCAVRKSSRRDDSVAHSTDAPPTNPLAARSDPPPADDEVVIDTSFDTGHSGQREYLGSNAQAVHVKKFMGVGDNVTPEELSAAVDHQTLDELQTIIATAGANSFRPAGQLTLSLPAGFSQAQVQPIPTGGTITFYMGMIGAVPAMVDVVHVPEKPDYTDAEAAEVLATLHSGHITKHKRKRIQNKKRPTGTINSPSTGMRCEYTVYKRQTESYGVTMCVPSLAFAHQGAVRKALFESWVSLN